MSSNHLRSWNDTATLQEIVEFVETAARDLRRELEWPEVLGRRARRLARLRAYLEPDRAPPGLRRRELERRHPLLRFAGGKGRPALRLLVLHDDAEREFDYVKGAEAALERARAESWTVVSVKDDWSTVFSAE